MTTAIHEKQVIELIAEMAEVKAETLSPSARLLDDLGIDGLDAVELFKSVQERFGTDLTELYKDWDQYFGPEGLPITTGLLLFGPAALAGPLVASAAGAVAGAIAAVLVFAATFWSLPKLIGRDMKQITVADVLRAVEAGAWPPSDAAGA